MVLAFSILFGGGAFVSPREVIFSLVLSVAFGCVGGGTIPLFCFLCAYVVAVIVVIIVLSSSSVAGGCSPLLYGDAAPRELSLARGMINFLCWRAVRLIVIWKALVDEGSWSTASVLRRCRVGA